VCASDRARLGERDLGSASETFMLAIVGQAGGTTLGRAIPMIAAARGSGSIRGGGRFLAHDSSAPHRSNEGQPMRGRLERGGVHQTR
jgi:hypothetical protein